RGLGEERQGEDDEAHESRLAMMRRGGRPRVQRTYSGARTPAGPAALSSAPQICEMCAMRVRWVDVAHVDGLLIFIMYTNLGRGLFALGRSARASAACCSPFTHPAHGMT